MGEPGPLSRQPPCPGCAPHEHHPFFGCEKCDCTAIDPFGVIEEY